MALTPHNIVRFPAPALRSAGAIEILAPINAKYLDSVRTIATSGTLSTMDTGSVVGGVTLALGDSFLYQPVSADMASPGVTNGIYVANADGVAPTRRSDADTGAELLNAAVHVREGTGAGQGWICINATAPAVGTDPIIFRLFQSGIVSGAPGAPGPGVAAGGAKGAYLRKTTASDYQTGWVLLKTRLAATRAELKGFDPQDDLHANLGESGRAGTFKAVLNSTLTAQQVAAKAVDTAEGIYIASTFNPAYTWLREEFTGANFHVGWFHNWATVDLQPAFAVAVAVMQALETRDVASVNALAARTILFPTGDWTLSGRTIIEQGGVHITAEGTCCLTCSGTNEAIVFRHPLYLDGQLLGHIKVTDLNFTRLPAVDGSDYYLRFYICRHVIVSRNEFRNGTVHVQFDAAYEPVQVFANTFWHNDAMKTNAYSLRIKDLQANTGATGSAVDADSGNTYLFSSMVWVFGNEMRAQIGDVQTHLYVEDIDGLQCFQNHFFNGAHQVEFKTVARGTGRIANVFIDHNFFDGGTDTVHSVYVPLTAGTAPLTDRLYIRSNKFNHTKSTHIETEAVMDELHIIDNEFDLAQGVLGPPLSGATGMIRTEGGIAVCRIENNLFRLQATASPTTDCINIFMTDLQQFKVVQLKNNFFGDDNSAAVYPPRAILLTGNPSNAGCKILIDDNVYDSAFAALYTHTSPGANVAVIVGTNTSYPT